MKKNIFICLLFFPSSFAVAQGSNLVVFTAQGEKFTLYVNGARINSSPELNVKATGINVDFVKIRVAFADNLAAEITKGIMIYDEATPPPVEVTYQIKTNKNGSYALQFVSSSNLQVEASSPVVTNTVVITPTPVVTSTVTTTEMKSETAESNNSISMIANSSVGEKAALNMNVKDGSGNNVSFNMSVNVGPETQKNTVQAQPTSSTIVTTTQTSYSGSTAGTTTISETCSPMNQSDFQEFVASIDDQASEENRLSIAKQGADNSCLSTKQVINILGLFASEERRLDFAKYAYSRASDRDKYHSVNSALYSQESVRQLSEYIKSVR